MQCRLARERSKQQLHAYTDMSTYTVDEAPPLDVADFYAVPHLSEQQTALRYEHVFRRGHLCRHGCDFGTTFRKSIAGTAWLGCSWRNVLKGFQKRSPTCR